MRTCSNCGQQLEADDPAKPCPSCGGSSPDVYVKTGGAAAGFTGHATGLSLAYGPERFWYMKWRSVQKHLEAVEADFRPGCYPGKVAIKRDLENFFIECFHLGDWLWSDPTTGLTKPQIFGGFIMCDSAMRVCEAMANTSKHHTRRSAEFMTARIAEVGYGQGGVRVTIRWSQARSSGTEDALDLARQCMAAWDGYIKDNGLKSPL